MVNETVDISAELVDSSGTQESRHQRETIRKLSPPLHPHPSTGDERNDRRQSDAVDRCVLPQSVENLSWNFFDKVASLDKQLRGVELSGWEGIDLKTILVLVINKSSRMVVIDSSSPKLRKIEIVADGCHLMSTDTATHDAAAALNGNVEHPVAIFGKTNGFAVSATLTDDVLPQPSPDLIVRPPSPSPSPSPSLSSTKREVRPAQTTTFQFTSPTATFKRKKEQHQQQQQQQQHFQIPNNNNNTKNNRQNNTNVGENQLPPQRCEAYEQHPLQQQQQQQQQERNECTSPNQTTTRTRTKRTPTSRGAAMISGGSIINPDAAAAAVVNATGTGTGTGLPRSARTRTLPVSISTTSGRHSHADGVDLVGDTRTNLRDNGTRQKIRPASVTIAHQRRMGATQHPAGAAAGRGGGGGGMGGMGGDGSAVAGACESIGKVSATHSFVEGLEMHLGLIGWRKKCLYTLLVLLMLLIITNLVLTLWILKVMEFTTDGMGQLKIVPGGIQLTGQALIMDMLRASTIRSRHGQPITIESSRNFSINTRDANGMLQNHLFLGHDKLECLSTGFRINDTAGRNLFSVNRNEVTIGAHALRVDGEGGAIFRDSIQTPHVRAEPGRELRLESPTRQLEMTAARDINLQSRAGGIELSALEDVKLSALDGSLRMESSKILMPNLRTAQTPSPGATQSHDHLHRVFQLCACSNGKLFLAAPHSICAGDDSTVCR